MKTNPAKSRYLYIGAYGEKFYAHTLKELKEQIPGKCNKMYVTVDGIVYHIGYVIGRLWLTKYVIDARPTK